METISSDCAGWWRIIDTGTWGSRKIDVLGSALLSLTGRADRLRLFVLLAYVNVKFTKSGVSFTWEGAWEFDQVSGSGRAAVGRDGRLRGRIRIKKGAESTFVAERAEAPEVPIPDSAELPGQVARSMVMGPSAGPIINSAGRAGRARRSSRCGTGGGAG